MLVKDAKLRGREGLWQIQIENGVFKKIAKSIESGDKEILDADGKLVLPPVR